MGHNYWYMSVPFALLLQLVHLGLILIATYSPGYLNLLKLYFVLITISISKVYSNWNCVVNVVKKIKKYSIFFWTASVEEVEA